MFATAEQAEAAVQIVTRAQPRWWVQAGPMLS
jgi:hypothetical protein